MRADMERSRDASLRPTVIRAVVLGVIASIIGIVLGLAINWFPAAGSTQADKTEIAGLVRAGAPIWSPAGAPPRAKKIAPFGDALILCAVPFFVLARRVVIVRVIKSRMRPGGGALAGPPIHGNTRLEVIWT